MSPKISKVDTAISKVGTVTSKVNKAIPKGDTVTPSVDKVSKVDSVTGDKPNGNTVTPSVDRVTTSLSPNSKTTNAELPDAGDSLVARLSALPVIGLGFGLLLRRRNREE